MAKKEFKAALLSLNAQALWQTKTHNSCLTGYSVNGRILILLDWLDTDGAFTGGFEVFYSSGTHSLKDELENLKNFAG